MAKLEELKIPTYVGTWSEIDRKTYNGVELILMENDQEGEELPALILNTNKEVVLDDIYNGWLDYEELLKEETNGK